MRKIGIGFILFVLAFVFYLGVSSCHAPASANMPACEITVPLDSLFHTMFPNPGDPGAVVIVRRGDSIMYNRSFGMADLERGIPLSDSTVFNIASASKTYVTAALVKLRDQGRLTLDDSLSMYFPNFKSPIFRRVTLRHVLSHTSGLPDQASSHCRPVDRVCQRLPVALWLRAGLFALWARRGVDSILRDTRYSQIRAWHEI